MIRRSSRRPPRSPRLPHNHPEDVTSTQCAAMSQTGIHPSAQIHPGAVIGTGTIVKANAVICENVVIGRNCMISAGAVIGARHLMTTKAVSQSRSPTMCGRGQ